MKEKARDNPIGNDKWSAQLGLRGGRFKLRILLDRTSVEVFGNGGEVLIPSCFLPQEGKGPEFRG